MMRRTQLRPIPGILAVVAIFVAVRQPAWSQAAADQLVNLRHWSGQGVAPVYEGYDMNSDGTFNMWFGYMNHNWEEALDIPIGPDNNFEPGGDHGQPTHFVVRRHKDVFKVTVPKDFGDQTLVWTLTAHGQTYKVGGSLKQTWIIDRSKTTRGGSLDNVASNTPPVVSVAQASAGSGAVTLNVSATDDGLPKRRGQSIGMTVEWAKYRGPGAVHFDPVTAKLVDGKATAKATFSEPGEYVLHAVVDDGSGEVAGNFGYHCCWTNAELRVTVK